MENKETGKRVERKKIRSGMVVNSRVVHLEGEKIGWCSSLEPKIRSRQRETRK